MPLMLSPSRAAAARKVPDHGIPRAPDTRGNDKLKVRPNWTSGRELPNGCSVPQDRIKAAASDRNNLLPKAPRPRKERVFASALLILIGVTLASIIAEAAVRLLGFGKPEFYAYSSTRGWKLRAGAAGWQHDEGGAFVRVNRWGYRGADWTRIKPRGTLRIAVLGDSFIEAQQVAEQDTACERIERQLSRMMPSITPGRSQGLRRVEVMNFGVDGYGTAQEFFTLVEDVWQFSPDIVVLAFFPGNNVRNNSAVLEGDKCRPFFVPHGKGVMLGGPFEDSHLFHFRCFLRFESYRSQLLNVLGEVASASAACNENIMRTRTCSRLCIDLSELPREACMSLESTI